MARRPFARLQLISILFAAFVVIFILVNVFGVLQSTRLILFPFERLLRTEVNTVLFDDQSVAIADLESELSQLRADNEQLREILKFTERTEFTQVEAHVISFDPIISTVLYIDQGSDNGIQIGQPVIVGDGVLIGRVARTTPATSMVELVTGDSTRFAVRTLDEDRTKGLLRGFLGTGARIEFVVTAENIEVDDVVETSGLEPLIPAGLLIGRITQINQNQNELFKEALVDPFADIENISIVSVIQVL